MEEVKLWFLYKVLSRTQDKSVNDYVQLLTGQEDDQRPRLSSGREMKPVYNVSKLYDAGIKFEVNEDEISLLKLNFSKGVLKIPKISMWSNTEVLVWNVVSFEQYHFACPKGMNDYALLFGFLIRTEKDVEILVEKGIIIVAENDEAASVVKRLPWSTPWRIESFFIRRNTASFAHFDPNYIFCHCIISEIAPKLL
ncbi:hypothetical protein K1719_017808 [Acacia pycnantha]|nr:hypothetical protein K1719_017808 [Acacia pycnantha]